MTISQEIGAPLARSSKSQSINWKDVEDQVKKLQFRIAKAIKSGQI